MAIYPLLASSGYMKLTAFVLFYWSLCSSSSDFLKNSPSDFSCFYFSSCFLVAAKLSVFDLLGYLFSPLFSGDIVFSSPSLNFSGDIKLGI